jgi:putative sigma-54 modulation protein
VGFTNTRKEKLMKIAIHCRRFGLTAALQEYTLHQLRSALSHTRAKVRHVTVRLCDLNGPRGGADKHCGIHVVVDGVGQVVTASTDRDLYAAISQAARRIGRGVSRRLRQKRMVRPSSLDVAAQP